MPDGHVMGKDSLCTFTIRSNRYKGRNRTGDLFSPTYPGLASRDHSSIILFLLGTYPKNIKCGYKFIGDPGQRIRLEFRDFDLFYGGAQ